jgi:hypothetical protein
MNLPFLPLPLHPVLLVAPEPHERVTLFFSSGAIRTGYWDGRDWICKGEVVAPDYWQALPLSDEELEPMTAYA